MKLIHSFESLARHAKWLAESGATPSLPFIMPLVRRIIPSLIANDVLQVQPMDGPAGLIFSMGNEVSRIDSQIRLRIKEIRKLLEEQGELTPARSARIREVLKIFGDLSSW